MESSKRSTTNNLERETIDYTGLLNDNINHNVHVILSTIFQSGQLITIDGTPYTILFYAVREDSLPKIVGKYANKVVTDDERDKYFSRLPIGNQLNVIDTNREKGENIHEVLNEKQGGGSVSSPPFIANPYQQQMPLQDMNEYYSNLIGIKTYDLSTNVIDIFNMQASKCQVGIDLRVVLGEVAPNKLACLVRKEKIVYNMKKLFTSKWIDFSKILDGSIVEQPPNVDDDN